MREENWKKQIKEKIKLNDITWLYHGIWFFEKLQMNLVSPVIDVMLASLKYMQNLLVSLKKR
jgi:hypothetical protein